MRLGVAGVLFAGSALVNVSPAHAAAGDSIIGNYTRQSGASADCFRTGFNVQTTASGTSGTYTEVGYRCDGSGYNGNFVTADITCLVVSGSEAVFSGPITSAGGIFAGNRSIREGSIDNSMPSSPANPDRAVTGRSATQPPSCDTPPPPSAFGPIIAGDIQITHGS
jgi:hypothetical protein